MSADDSAMMFYLQLNASSKPKDDIEIMKEIEEMDNNSYQKTVFELVEEEMAKKGPLPQDYIQSRLFSATDEKTFQCSKCVEREPKKVGRKSVKAKTNIENPWMTNFNYLCRVHYNKEKEAAANLIKKEKKKPRRKRKIETENTEKTAKKQKKVFFCVKCNEKCNLGTCQCRDCLEWVHLKCAGYRKPSDVPKAYKCFNCLHGLKS